MGRLTQEEQKRNSPFTLEAVLEEESEVNDSYINDALPFDKCLKADAQVEETERKKELSRQLGTAKTTADQSKKEIRKWIGIGIIIKTILKENFLELIGIVISTIDTIGFWSLLSNFLNQKHTSTLIEATLKVTCLVVFISISIIIGVYALLSIATTKYNFITTKMNEKDYLIKEDIVDCPIAVKEMLLSYIEADELYGRVNKERKRFEWLQDNGEVYHYWTFDKPKNKNDIEYQMKYLADQLEAGKIYRLSDIITDKVKKKASE